MKKVDYKRKLARTGMLLKNTTVKWNEELSEPWDGMSDDLEVAMNIIYPKLQAGETLRLLDDFEIDEKADMVRVKMPAWIMEIRAAIAAKYTDESEIQYRFQRTLSSISRSPVVSSD